MYAGMHPGIPEMEYNGINCDFREFQVAVFFKPRKLDLDYL